MTQPFLYKRGNCPYCKSDIPLDALVCRTCSRDVFLFNQFVDSVENNELNTPPAPTISEGNINTPYLLIHLLLSVCLGIFLLGIQNEILIGGFVKDPTDRSVTYVGGSQLFYFQLFLWGSALVYSFVSVHYFSVRNLWVLALLPAIVPVMMVALVTAFEMRANGYWVRLTQQRFFTIYVSVGISVIFGLLYWTIRKGVALKPMLGTSFLLNYLTTNREMIESVQKIVLAIISIGSIVIFLIDLLKQ